LLILPALAPEKGGDPRSGEDRMNKQASLLYFFQLHSIHLAAEILLLD
jgi:hypothetical protein